MQVKPFLQVRTAQTMHLPLAHHARAGIMKLFGEELKDWKDVFELPTVSAGVHIGREWFVVDTAFGCQYLALADMQGRFILMPVRADIPDVLVEFDGPIDPNNRPRRRHTDNNFNPVPHRNRQQYLMFLTIAERLVFQAEQASS